MIAMRALSAMSERKKISIQNSRNATCLVSAESLSHLKMVGGGMGGKRVRG